MITHSSSAHKFRITVCIAFALFGGSTLLCSADVSKADLSKRVYAAVFAVLQPAVDASGSSTSSETQQERAMAISQMVLSSNTASYPPDFSDWIVSSFVSLIKGRALILLRTDQEPNDLLSSLAAQVNIRLNNVSPETASSLLDRRKTLLASAAVFNQDLRQYLMTKFGDPQEIDITMPVTRHGIDDNFIDDHGYDHFKAVVNDLGCETGAQGGVCNLCKSAVMSKLLELTLIHQVDMDLKESAAEDSFSFGNLFSRAFDDSNKNLRIDDFEQARSRFEEKLAVTSSPTSHTMAVNYQSFSQCILDATSVRMKLPGSLTAERTNIPVPNITLKIRNTPEFWKFLPAANDSPT